MQGSRVQLELEVLRQKHLAKNQRNKLKDSEFLELCSILSEVLFFEEVRPPLIY